MRAAQLTAVFVLLAANAQAATRLSPIPGDCVPDTAVTAASTDGLTYFPAPFRTEGDIVSVSANKITQARVAMINSTCLFHRSVCRSATLSALR